MVGYYPVLVEMIQKFDEIRAKSINIMDDIQILKKDVAKAKKLLYRDPQDLIHLHVRCNELIQISKALDRM
jgi:hypothetical protein